MYKCGGLRECVSVWGYACVSVCVCVCGCVVGVWERRKETKRNRERRENLRCCSSSLYCPYFFTTTLEPARLDG